MFLHIKDSGVIINLDSAESIVKMDKERIVISRKNSKELLDDIQFLNEKCRDDDFNKIIQGISCGKIMIEI